MDSNQLMGNNQPTGNKQVTDMDSMNSTPKNLLMNHIIPNIAIHSLITNRTILNKTSSSSDIKEGIRLVQESITVDKTITTVIILTNIMKGSITLTKKEQKEEIKGDSSMKNIIRETIQKRKYQQSILNKQERNQSLPSNNPLHLLPSQNPNPWSSVSPKLKSLSIHSLNKSLKSMQILK